MVRINLPTEKKYICLKFSEIHYKLEWLMNNNKMTENIKKNEYKVLLRDIDTQEYKKADYITEDNFKLLYNNYIDSLSKKEQNEIENLKRDIITKEKKITNYNNSKID